jgi:hypothetical protein
MTGPARRSAAAGLVRRSGREHAIATWPTTATSIGVRSDHNGFKVCAPFGLTDLFAMVVRPNAKLVSQAVYQAKAERWRLMWPRLTVLPWPTKS